MLIFAIGSFCRKLTSAIAAPVADADVADVAVAVAVANIIKLKVEGLRQCYKLG